MRYLKLGIVTILQIYIGYLGVRFFHGWRNPASVAEYLIGWLVVFALWRLGSIVLGWEGAERNDAWLDIQEAYGVTIAFYYVLGLVIPILAHSLVLPAGGPDLLPDLWLSVFVVSLAVAADSVESLLKLKARRSLALYSCAGALLVGLVAIGFQLALQIKDANANIKAFATGLATTVPFFLWMGAALYALLLRMWTRVERERQQRLPTTIVVR